MKAYVYVSLKKSVLDPQGKTIQGALKKMGYAAVKAHPGLRCSDYDALVARLSENGFDPVDDNRIPGPRRCHIHDPFGNRIELIAAS